MTLDVRITRIREGVQIPQYETSGAAGCDLSAALEVTVDPGEIALIPTGLVIATPPGYALLLCSRSSSPRKHGISPPHGIGVIDEDYCGPTDEVCVQVMNITSSPITIPAGTRIAQALFVPVARANFFEAEPQQTTSRGGFGSTDS